MSEQHEDLAARLNRQLTRRKQLAKELERLSDEARAVTANQDPPPWWLRSAGNVEAAAARAPLSQSGPASVTVIVPVHNAFEELTDCLRALARHTTFPSTVLLVDDASTDPRIDDLLELAINLEGLRVLRNVENLGFTATVNRALRSCADDVVLLNSDTEVGPRWLEQLVATAYSAPDIGTVTPVSDNAGAFSVPRPNEPNPLPLSLSVGDVARLFAAEGSPELPESPTGNGFCMYVKRAVIEAAGEFDAESFPRGYGEENDFCMRALRLGWRHVVDSRVFVHHQRESSFGAKKAALIAAGRTKLDELHPDYTARARAFVSGEPMAAVRAQAKRVLEHGRTAVRPRLLFVIHDGAGGAIATNADLMRALAPEFDCFVFSSDRWTLRFARIIEGELETLKEWPLEKAILLAHFSRPDYRAAFREVLARCQPELMHVRHVFKHTLDAPKMAAAASIPVVMSIHDYYTICPTIQLVDNLGQFCGGPCSPGHGDCPTLVKAGRLPPLKHAFVYQWREEMDAALRGVDTFVTTSAQAREIHRQMHATIRSRPFHLIEHGRDLEQASGISEPPVPGGKVRILVAGNLDRHKGTDLIRAMQALDVDERLELHFLGDVPQRYRDLGIMHGPYSRRDFLTRVGEIRPSFIGIFSVWAETYNHVLTEAWAAGIPALVTDIGAPAERVRAHGGGFLVPLESPEAALRAVLDAADDAESYAVQAAQATIEGIPTIDQMTERYANLYREVIERRRVVAAPAHVKEEPLSRGIWRMTALIPGRFPSAYVRVLRRYHHPEVQWKLRTRVRTDLDALALDDTDLVLVQRHAVAADEVARFVEQLRRRHVPLVLDLDDHLLSSDYGDAHQFASRVEPMRILLDAAAVVIVSTTALAQTLRELCRSIVVVPNQLDERLFLAGVGDEPPGGPPPAPGRPIRLLYAGSPSHAEDLAFLRTVLARLEAEHPGRFELNVIGGERESVDGDWYRRRGIPAGGTDYPSYVALLRQLRPEWDIAVAPLLDTPFNRHKSDLKFLEYSGLGLPGVYSAVEAYASVRDRDTGLRIGNDVESWCGALTELADAPELGERLRTAAWAEVTGKRLLRHAAAELLQTIGAVLRGAPADHRAQSGEIAPAVTGGRSRLPT